MTNGEQQESQERKLVQARSFGPAAEEYERGRPEYPAAAVDWLLGAGRVRQVLDLGAGTGKLTRQLVARGLDVTAVEPLAGMRQVLARAVPGAVVREGSAEALPLADASVDAVLVAQAWHWVDPERAVPEVARVLRPGGTLGLVWNYRDTREDWVGQLGRLMHTAGEEWEGRDEKISAVGAPFDAPERHLVRWTAEMSGDQVVDMVASRSYVITLPDAERAELLAQVRELLATHPATAGRERVALPYVTYCYRAALA